LSSSGGFHDLLFEMSNEYRYGILLILRDQAKRLTELTRDVGLTLTEVRRHVARLSQVGLIQKDTEGHYHLTEIGKIVLIEIQEFDFVARNKEYLNSHTLQGLPTEFIKRLGDLCEGRHVGSVVEFIRQTDSTITEAQEYVWLLVDQLPIHNLSSILGAVERGVEFRVIEPVERVLNPDLDSLTSEETRALARTRQTPLTEQRMRDEINLCLYISERKCALSFPTEEGVFDYTGLIATDEKALGFCKDVFNHYWNKSELRTSRPPRKVKRGPVAVAKDLGRIIVTGCNDPEVDAQAVQNAVDNYDEVILRGTFNLGTSTIVTSRSVVIRGEGREDDLPSTKVYKSGWTYPFYRKPGISRENRVFLVDGEGADVTIENIHFTDFEYKCLDGLKGNSLTIRNNRITLQTCLGRAIKYHDGNQVIGIMQFGGFPGGVIIEGNYLDFALSYGPLNRSARANDRAEDPDYRPDLTQHVSYLGFGITIFYACGKVIIENNTVRNMNARGIVAADNTGSADIRIRNNTVVSEIYGSYYSVPRFAGCGIKATSGWHVGPAPHVEISHNTIRCDKINYCGIGLTGPELGPIGAEKLVDGMVKDNRIHLENGSIGILTESCDGFQITDNTLTGKAYYGIGIFPGVDKNRTEIGAHENVIEGNNIGDLRVKVPDEYSQSLLYEKRCSGSKAGLATAHVWLNTNTKGNVVTIRSDETVIDEGEGNTVEHVVDKP